MYKDWIYQYEGMGDEANIVLADAIDEVRGGSRRAVEMYFKDRLELVRGEIHIAADRSVRLGHMDWRWVASEPSMLIKIRVYHPRSSSDDPVD